MNFSHKKVVIGIIVFSLLFHCNFLMKEPSEDTFPKTASFFVASDTVADGVSDVERKGLTTDAHG